MHFGRVLELLFWRFRILTNPPTEPYCTRMKHDANQSKEKIRKSNSLKIPNDEHKFAV